MGRKSSNKFARADEERSGAAKPPILAPKEAVDPALASLFSTSLGPTKPPQRSYPTLAAKEASPQEAEAESEDEDQNEDEDEGEDDGLAEGSSDAEMDDEEEDEEDEEDDEVEEKAKAAALGKAVHGPETNDSSQRKRKRKQEGEELEEKYLRKLAKEEEKEEAERRVERASKRVKATSENEDGEEAQIDAETSASGSEAGDAIGADESDDEGFEIPQHESLAPTGGADELERSSRTVFLGNVSNEAIASKSAKKELIRHLESFVAALPAHTPPHKVESIRFRSTAFASSIPKKAAFAKKELMDATTKSTNAYAVYTTQVAAREAARRLNGTKVLGRHLRVDEVAHPAKVDHRRCVFVGNLDFVDDESGIRAAAAAKDGKTPKPRQPADVEEGLWEHMSKAGKVESVRVVRDPKTRVGKGFAYVQFTDENGVEAALQFNDKKFPPLLPRKLRVVRAKAIKRNTAKHRDHPTTRSASAAAANAVYNPKTSAEQRSALGRAGKLLGRAGAAQFRRGGPVRAPPASAAAATGAAAGPGGVKPPEQFVFEGHRASSKQGNAGLKLRPKGSGKKSGGGKPKNRSSKRGAAWKAQGGKK